MKITFTLLIITIWYIFVLALKLTSAATTTHVLDIQGKSLKKGTKYYILPVVRGRGGGLRLADDHHHHHRNATCPPGVVQDRFETSPGLPLTFSPANRTERFITLSSDLNFKFSAPSRARTACTERSTVWRLGDFNEAAGRWFVTAGGVQGNPGPKTISNWFKIERVSESSSSASSRDYKLVFCPTVCNFCKVICRDVGVFVSGRGGVRRLALTETAPLVVMFKRA